MQSGKRIDLRDDENPAEITVFRIGDNVIVGCQGEIFVEYGIELKKASPLEKTFVFEVTNGALPGYIFTNEAFDEGGYEVGTSVFTREAGEVLTEAIKSLF